MDLIYRQTILDALAEINKEVEDGDGFRYEKWREYFTEMTSPAQLQSGGDTISRQAAIDIEHNATVDTNPSHFEAHQKFMQFMDDAEISSFGRWQWSNGFNTALTAIGIDLKKLPSAQPDLSSYSDKLWRAAYERGKAEAQRKRGRWIGYNADNSVWLRDDGEPIFLVCSECHRTVLNNGSADWNFCPNCGADMREGQDETN